jgi:hypothetical protein
MADYNGYDILNADPRGDDRNGPWIARHPNRAFDSLGRFPTEAAAKAWVDAALGNGTLPADGRDLDDHRAARVSEGRIASAAAQNDRIRRMREGERISVSG